MSFCTIRRHLQKSGISTRRPLLRLPLTGNHRRLRQQRCDKRDGQRNRMTLCLLTRLHLQHNDGRIRVWRHRGERLLKCCVTHRHTVCAPGIMV
ncbi:transposable element Tcb1 transposase [Trichonephila clavipes]|nr:transposable element Tcb1 transposase [Trichonephila clavipes]